MSIEKKSLINTLKTTKKANVASAKSGEAVKPSSKNVELKRQIEPSRVQKGFTKVSGMRQVQGLTQTKRFTKVQGMTKTKGID